MGVCAGIHIYVSSQVGVVETGQITPPKYTHKHIGVRVYIQPYMHTYTYRHMSVYMQCMYGCVYACIYVTYIYVFRWTLSNLDR